MLNDALKTFRKPLSYFLKVIRATFENFRKRINFLNEVCRHGYFAKTALALHVVLKNRW
jgi:hypothetical protein